VLFRSLVEAQTEVRTAAEDAQVALADELTRLGVASPDETREAATLRLQAEAERDRARDELDHLLNGETLEDIAEQLEAVTARLADAADDVPQADVASAEESARRAQEERDHAQTLLAQANKSRDTFARDHLEKAKALTAAQSEEQTARTERDRATTTLDEARTADPDAAILGAATQAQLDAESKQAELEAAVTRYAAAEPDSVDERLAHASTRAGIVQDQCEKVRNEALQTETLLEDRASQGLYDALERAKAELDEAQARRRRLDRAAKAAKLLRDTLLRHQDAARAKYVAPFTHEIERLGRVVFGPDFTVEVSQDLTVVSRTMGGRTVPFESLSAGTREQLALIGRLACAALIDPDDGAPVILDDTLGFADPERLRNLGTVLGAVGRKAQVILLTCQPDRFANLGGARVVRLTRD
jgi:hypothetical protein